MILHTDGKGLWTKQVKKVIIKEVDITFWDGDDYGSIIVYYDSNFWNVKKDGLIYTDKLWIKEFKQQLRKCGFSQKATNNVDYSEQGRQGEYYVDLDFGSTFFYELDMFHQFATARKIKLPKNWAIIKEGSHV